jgi:hypothetical protein
VKVLPVFRMVAAFLVAACLIQAAIAQMVVASAIIVINGILADPLTEISMVKTESQP